MNNAVQWLRVAMAAAVVITAPTVAMAQSYPNRPITFVIGYPPGTAYDAASRTVGAELTKRLGQPVVIEHKPGASSTIGAKFVVNAKPDGYTLLYGGMMAIHPIFNRNNAVDAGRELIPVSQFGTIPYLLVARANLPVNSLQDLVAYAKARPGTLKHGSPSPVYNLGMQMLKVRTGVDAEAIPYKAGPQITVALLAGEVDLAVGSEQNYKAQIEAGKIRPLFFMSARRSPTMPAVPTAAEAGLPNFQLGVNHGLWAPMGTPRDVVEKLNTEIVAILKLPAVVEQIEKAIASSVSGTTPEEQLRIFNDEAKFLGEAARLSNYHPD